MDDPLAVTVVEEAAAQGNAMQTPGMLVLHNQRQTMLPILLHKFLILPIVDPRMDGVLAVAPMVTTTMPDTRRRQTATLCR
jgi:hypothetical protein